MSIQRRIQLAVTALSCLAILIMGAFSLYISRTTLMDRSEDFMATILQGAVFEIDQRLQATEKVTETLGAELAITFNPARAQEETNYLPTYLDKYKSSVNVAADLSPAKSAFVIVVGNQGTKAIWFADGNGDFIPEGQAPNTYPGAIDPQEIMEQEKVNLWINDLDDQVIYQVRRVAFNDAYVMIVGSGTSTAGIFSTINANPVMDAGFLFLTDSQGRLIYAPGPTRPFDSVVLHSPGQGDKERPDDFLDQTQSQVGDLVYASQALRNGWHLGVAVPFQVLTSGLDAIVIVIVVMILIVMLLASFSGNLIAKALAKPVVYIAETIDQVGQGNYDVAIQDNFKDRMDEVGVLTRSLQIMISRQKATFDEIKEYSESLEHKVEERTQELTQANNELEDAMGELMAQRETLMVTNEKLEQSIEEIEATRKRLVETEKLASLRLVVIGLAHKLNTPIGNAKTLSSHLIQTVDKLNGHVGTNTLSKRQLIEFMKDMDESGANILQNLNTSIEIINKLKGYSKVQRTLSSEAQSMEQVVRDAYLETSMKYREIPCQIQVHAHDQAMLDNHGDSLKQILVELMENSFVHGFTGQASWQIEVSIAKGNQGQNWVIQYKDNGGGVNAQMERDLFTPLYTSQMSSNLGLGLSMVYAIVKDVFDGDIQVLSHQEEGLGFEITF